MTGREATVVEPAHAGQEREVLLGFLQRQRDLVGWKVEGLDDDAARAVATPSGLTVHVLLRHLRGVEHGWLREVFAGEPELPGPRRRVRRPGRRPAGRPAGGLRRRVRARRRGDPCR